MEHWKQDTPRRMQTTARNISGERERNIDRNREELDRIAIDQKRRDGVIDRNREELDRIRDGMRRQKEEQAHQQRYGPIGYAPANSPR